MTLYKKFVSEWVNLHLNGLNANQIAKKYGCNQWTVGNLLKKRGVYKKATKEISKTQKSLILKLYKQGYSLPEIAKKVGFSRETARYYVNRANLMRSIKEATKLHQYRDIKPLALTPELAFFLGVHAGDGSLGGGNNDITRWRCFLGSEEIELGRKIEKTIIELFRSKPKIIQTNNQIILDLYSKPIMVTLTFYGFPVGKKSRTVKVPQQILKSKDHDVIISFLSGLLATDGYVSMKKSGKNRYPHAEISTSSKSLAQDVLKLLEKISIDAKILCSIYKNSYSQKEKYKIIPYQRCIREFLSKVHLFNDKHIKRLEGNMELEKAIKSRHSIRKFQSKEIEENKIQKILELTNLAPSAGN